MKGIIGAVLILGGAWMAYKLAFKARINRERIGFRTPCDCWVCMDDAPGWRGGAKR